MELLKIRKIAILIGSFLIILALGVFLLYLRSDWKVVIKGLSTTPDSEIRSYVNYYLKQNPQKVSGTEIEEILRFHPRISSVSAKIRLKTISITVTEKNTGFLLHTDQIISEISRDDQVLQEMVIEKNALSEDIPIFYLTAEKEPEIETIRSDIIRLWDKTKSSHSFIWNRLSEIVLSRDEMNNPEINFFHSFMPLKITIYNKMDINALRQLWAMLYLVENEKLPRISFIRIYHDHAVME